MTGKNRNDRTGWDMTRQDNAGYDMSVKTVKHISTKVSAFAQQIIQPNRQKEGQRDGQRDSQRDRQ